MLKSLSSPTKHQRPTSLQAYCLDYATDEAEYQASGCQDEICPVSQGLSDRHEKLVRQLTTCGVMLGKTNDPIWEERASKWRKQAVIHGLPRELTTQIFDIGLASGKLKKVS